MGVVLISSNVLSTNHPSSSAWLLAVVCYAEGEEMREIQVSLHPRIWAAISGAGYELEQHDHEGVDGG